MSDHYVYILASRRSGTLYVGVTSDLLRRIYEYKNGYVGLLIEPTANVPCPYLTDIPVEGFPYLAMDDFARFAGRYYLNLLSLRAKQSLITFISPPITCGYEP
jgi:hypothetical protein